MQLWRSRMRWWRTCSKQENDMSWCVGKTWLVGYLQLYGAVLWILFIFNNTVGRHSRCREFRIIVKFFFQKRLSTVHPCYNVCSPTLMTFVTGLTFCATAVSQLRIVSSCSQACLLYSLKQTISCEFTFRYQTETAFHSIYSLTAAVCDYLVPAPASFCI